VIVVDASAALSALLNAGPARRALADTQLHVPHLIDSEVASVLRRRVLAREMDPGVGWNALDTWRRLGMTRYQVRDNVSAHDASYVALAEYLDCSLVTADGRLGRVRGIRCLVSVVPPY